MAEENTQEVQNTNESGGLRFSGEITMPVTPSTVRSYTSSSFDAFYSHPFASLGLDFSKDITDPTNYKKLDAYYKKREGFGLTSYDPNRKKDIDRIMDEASEEFYRLKNIYNSNNNLAGMGWSSYYGSNYNDVQLGLNVINGNLTNPALKELKEWSDRRWNVLDDFDLAYNKAHGTEGKQGLFITIQDEDIIKSFNAKYNNPNYQSDSNLFKPYLLRIYSGKELSNLSANDEFGNWIIEASKQYGIQGDDNLHIFIPRNVADMYPSVLGMIYDSREHSYEDDNTEDDFLNMTPEWHGFKSLWRNIGVSPIGTPNPFSSYEFRMPQFEHFGTGVLKNRGDGPAYDANGKQIDEETFGFWGGDNWFDNGAVLDAGEEVYSYMKEFYNFRHGVHRDKESIVGIGSNQRTPDEEEMEKHLREMGFKRTEIDAELNKYVKELNKAFKGIRFDNGDYPIRISDSERINIEDVPPQNLNLVQNALNNASAKPTLGYTFVSGDVDRTFKANPTNSPLKAVFTIKGEALNAEMFKDKIQAYNKEHPDDDPLKLNYDGAATLYQKGIINTPPYSPNGDYYIEMPYNAVSGIPNLDELFNSEDVKINNELTAMTFQENTVKFLCSDNPFFGNVFLVSEGNPNYFTLSCYGSGGKPYNIRVQYDQNLIELIKNFESLDALQARINMTEDPDEKFEYRKLMNDALMGDGESLIGAVNALLNLKGGVDFGINPGETIIPNKTFTLDTAQVFANHPSLNSNSLSRYNSEVGPIFILPHSNKAVSVRKDNLLSKMYETNEKKALFDSSKFNSSNAEVMKYLELLPTFSSCFPKFSEEYEKLLGE